MARVKRGVVARRRHKKVIARAKGHYGARSRVYRVAKQSVIKADQYAYIGRKQKKRQFRSLWITRINAAARQFDLSYSRLINGLKQAEIEMDRKVLADLAVNDIKAFGAIADKAREALGMGVSDKTGVVDYKPVAAPKKAQRQADKPAASKEEPKKAAAKKAEAKEVEPKEAEPKKAEPKKAAAKKAEPKKAEAKKAEPKADKLNRIEGIGPKTAELLQGEGIKSFADLAAADVDKLKELLHEAGSGFAAHDPTTWPEQAKLAADGKFDELKKWQDELDGGRPA